MVIDWYPYKIPVVAKEMAEDEFGEFIFYPTPKIHLSKDLQGSIYSSTLLHEILEMVNEVHYLGLTEGDIRTLEISLSQIMGQNPNLPATVFPPRPPECPQSDPGDEHGSEGLRDARIDPEAF